MIGIIKAIATIVGFLRELIPLVQKFFAERRAQKNHEVIQDAAKKQSAEDAARDVNDLFRGTKSEKPKSTDDSLPPAS